MKNVSNKLSYFAVSIIMGAIIISFVLTGFTGLGSNAGEVASVDGTPITAREYNQALQFNLDRYAQMFGGKSLTNAQIKQFKIKESTLDSLIGQKHMLNFANELKFDAGKEHIKEEIKNYEYFQTGGKFDVNKYKNLLQANRLSPAKFEEDIINQIKSNRLQNLLSSIQDSKSATENIMKLREFKLITTAVSFEKEALTEFIPVDKKKVTEFINDKGKEAILKSLYRTYESEINTKNQMTKNDKKVKAEKVLAFDKVKKDLAKKHIQKTMRTELTTLTEDLKKNLSAAMESGNSRELKKLAKRYNLNLNEKYEMGLFNLRYENIEIKQDEILNIAKNEDKKTVVTVDNPNNFALIKLVSTKKANIEDEALKTAIKGSTARNGQILRNSIIDYKNKTSKVLTNPNIFL